jgi:alkylation response protein AidB-like acyl-CoA dehydrogenase
MDLHPTPDQDEITDSAATYLLRELPAHRIPHLTDTALAPDQWKGLAHMGWFAMGLPEEAGGLGLSAVEEALVLRQFGRHLIPPQALGTMLAAHFAHMLGNADLTRALIEGQVRAAIAVPLNNTTGNLFDGEYRLVDTNSADLVIGWSEAGAFLAPTQAFGDRAVAASMDATIEMTTAESLELSQARWLANQDSDFLARATVLTAAMLTGGAEAVRDISTDYAKERQQFGQPIGRFQAIATECAQMAVRAEAALACLFYAAVCVRDGLPERDLYCDSARSIAFRANHLNATAAMQVHGGYGQTYEYLPHFYFKRATIYGLVGGGVEADEARILAAPLIML